MKATLARIIPSLFICFIPVLLIAQNNNGLLDQLEELGTRYEVPIRLPGGAELATDIYLPITQDSLVVSFTVPLVNSQFFAELIPKGTQLIIYPEMYDNTGSLVPNPNPYQLPFLLSRTPYDKAGLGAAGPALPLLGYGFVNQDTRGRFESGGVFLPLYSDSWQKAPYNPDNHLLDVTFSTDSANGRFHSDGINTEDYILQQFQKGFDLTGNGVVDTIAPACNGTIGLFGASAFAIPNMQLAASRRIQPGQPGIKGMVNLIATIEHFNSTGYQNGAYRERLVSEWLRGQLFDMQDSIGTDNDLQNDLHSPFDYGAMTKEEVLKLALHHVTSYRYPSASVANYYPNSPQRAEMDASYAPVDANGEGDPAGAFSRYTNIQTPNYHVTGWYDIFVNGQLETWQNARDHLPLPYSGQQKIIIGPWSHFTLGTTTVGDLTYPDNVGDALGATIDLGGLTNLTNLNIAELLQIEPLSFMRYSLNQNGHVQLGEPVVRIPENSNWQGGSNFQVRIPAADYDLSVPDLLNFLLGQDDLSQVPIEVDIGLGPLAFNVNIPSPGAILPFSLSDPIQDPKPVDFDTMPNVRFYVIGPQDNLPANQGVGNYWYAADEYPIQDTNLVTYVDYYLHNNGLMDNQKPITDEGFSSYTHDPDNPVRTIGGGNLFIETPDGRDAVGQMNLADPLVASQTLNHPGVIQFETATLTDTLSVVGFPKATLYAKSEPQSSPNGPTDTDFFIRIVDVYPDGREFFVAEGAVNARAREYARSIYNGSENANAAFSNIQSGQVYEYQFELLPIAYTFGIDHKMKVLISSSNYPRYQSNPNVPIEPGEFYRRPSGDTSRSYNFQGQSYTARIAQNSIAFSDSLASRLELPLLNYSELPDAVVKEPIEESGLLLAPNPARNWLQVQFEQVDVYELKVYDNLGRVVLQQQVRGQQVRLGLQGLPAGVYRLEAINAQQKVQVASFVKE